MCRLFVFQVREAETGCVVCQFQRTWSAAKSKIARVRRKIEDVKKEVRRVRAVLNGPRNDLEDEEHESFEKKVAELQAKIEEWTESIPELEKEELEAREMWGKVEPMFEGGNIDILKDTMESVLERLNPGTPTEIKTNLKMLLERIRQRRSEKQPARTYEEFML
jgi:predicted RNase H-like nuclease (RuvC/YqgF family)